MLQNGPKFVCVDRPEFEGHHVDWDNLLARLSFYDTEEKEDLVRWDKSRTELAYEKSPGFFKIAEIPSYAKHSTNIPKRVVKNS